MTAESPVPPVRLTHYQARERWGEPDTWEGSVNDPRTREEYGIRYNEKWAYLLEGGDRRLVYWHRYDCRGVVLEKANGEVEWQPV